MADAERPAGTTTGTLMVVSGGANLLWALSIWFAPCIGSLAIVPALAGIAELVVGSTILGKNPSSRVQLVSALGLVSGVLTMNPVSVGLEIAALITQGRNPPKQLEG